MNLPVRRPERAGDAAQHPFAVIDVGSNSVRMVVFEALKRAAVAVFNEKVLCGLGRGVGERGALDDAAADLALRTIGRFVALAEAMDVGGIEAVATAAVREAGNGADFVAAIERRCGLRVRILTGEEEGRYSALGVAAAIPQAHGVVGDLGGGSLELIAVAQGRPGASATLPLGPLRLGERIAGRAADVDRTLAAVDWLAERKGTTLYCVGGAWRSLARVHMRQRQAPLHIIHEYRVRGSDVAEFAHLLTKLSPGSLASIEGVSAKRTAAVPPAALVLERLIRTFAPKDVVFCGYGLREGLLHSRLSADEQARDPFLAYCEDEARRNPRFALHADEVMAWLAPVLGAPDAEQVQRRRGAILLSEIAWRAHPDYRAELALVRVLHAPFVGISHRGRALVALAVYERYRGDMSHALAGEARKLLDEREIERALTLGQILDLAHTLSGGAPGLLPRTALRLEGPRLVLDLPRDLEAFAGEVVTRRLGKLARHLGLEPEVALRP